MMCFCKKYRANKSVSQPYSITNFINILVISGLLCIYNKCKFKCNHVRALKWVLAIEMYGTAGSQMTN
jgi:hypothetical protein